MAYIHVEIDDDLHTWFKVICAKNGTTMTAELCALLGALRSNPGIVGLEDVDEADAAGEEG